MPVVPETVTLYLSTIAGGNKASTLQRRISAISQAHHAVGLEPPTRSVAVRAVITGIRCAKGIAQRGKAAAVTTTIRIMLATLPESLLVCCDRALLLVGFAAALRCSDVVGLGVAGQAFTRDRLMLMLRCSRTDQDGQHPDDIPAAQFAGCLFNTDHHVDGHRLAIDRLQRGFKLRPVPALNLISHKNVRRPEDNMIAIP
jgi:hypothetical protein